MIKRSMKYFITNAKIIHKDKYDYSKVKLQKWKSSKIIIICPIHGEFQQTPYLHINQKHGCPKCKYEKMKQTNLKKYGIENVFQSKDIMTNAIIEKQKNSRKKSLKEKYNVTNVSQLDDIKEKVKQTCLRRYDVECYSKSDEGKRTLSKIISGNVCQEKTKQTNLKRYGVECTFNIKYARDNQNKALHSESYSKKRKLIGKDVSLKSWNTRKKNGTTNTSSFEQTVYKYLLDNFNKDDTFKDYNLDMRYPYHCDFYIKSLDLFIELNIHWTHGDYWFDKTNIADINRLKTLKIKSRNNPQYKTAITVWAIKDLEKLEKAKENNLNYIVLWNKNDVNRFIHKIDELKEGSIEFYESY